jgi:hypothetical protein
MTPSVEGRRKVLVAVLLIGSAASAGALLGFAVGVAWLASPLPALQGWAALLVVAGAVALDLLAPRIPRLRPPSVGRQVPREWSRYFSPTTVAVLYGARLGVGPATILPTWLWWAVLVLAAGQGVGTSVAAGATFGGVRTVLMVALAEWVRQAAAVRMARLRGMEVGARGLLPLAAVAIVLLAV